ncbi:hypothetical protein niasHT_010254 [Heterodera trifolii]|uniref:Cytochrome c oxidase assembly protein COX11, mitochondrial n=1 Tax=Heterodera trifolii TaxID=157864 RepID=A0ABD2LR30_9BILA
MLFVMSVTKIASTASVTTVCRCLGTILNRHRGPILFANRTVSFYTLFNRRRSPPSLHLMTDRQRRIDEACRGLGWVFIMVGVTFAALPLYRMFCESTGFGGTTNVAKALEHIEQMNTVPERLIRVRFNADVNSSMQWKFKPVQNEIYVNPGETALAFFTAENPSDRPIVGISTYNLTPFQAAYYFNKIQCFCFDEQILRPGETVDLPVFFYIDPEYVNDPQLEYIDDMMLSYTFFESKSNLMLPSPFDPTNRPLLKNNNGTGESSKNGNDLVKEKRQLLEKA